MNEATVPAGTSARHRARVVPAVLALALFAGAGVVAIPRGIEAQHLLAIEDDPVRIAERALDERFNADLAAREIEAALAADDADLANSFAELARERNVALDPALTAKVETAVADAGSTRRAMESFAMGFVSGEPKDMAGFAGTAVGDLMVFGDIRDAAREGARLATGEPADTLVLGLAGVGLAITAGTYATGGVAAPARVGVSLAKAARKAGRLGSGLADNIGRTLSRVVDWTQLKTAVGRASVTEPMVAIRGARAAVKMERAGDLVHLARDVGRVQAKAGTQAALDGLKIAESPREMARLAKLAEKQGGKTRAILKTAGRGAIALSIAAIDLGLWILGALFAAFGMISSLKSATERATSNALRRRKERRLAEQQRKFAAMTARG
ncbi:MAG: hypothetical protein AB7E67_02775 [Xanthobacteraceae bacterium]